MTRATLVCQTMRADRFRLELRLDEGGTTT